MANKLAKTLLYNQEYVMHYFLYKLLYLLMKCDKVCISVLLKEKSRNT